MNTVEKIKSGRLDEQLTRLYPACQTESHKTRYIDVAENFRERFNRGEFELFSIPGRTEIIGNHTDHNLGKVIAAAVNLDIAAAAAKSDGGKIRIVSRGFGADEIDLNDLGPKESERFTSKALAKGVIAALKMKGYNIGAFDAYLDSKVPKGSGLSSSAAFEVTVGAIVNHLFNGGRIDAVTIAKAAQQAENEYFGKPCGLMDQMACALGGLVQIDFGQPENPKYVRIETDISKLGYSLCIVDTGSSHEDLHGDYAAIKDEMQAVARHFSRGALRGCTIQDILANIKALRKEAGDRAILRALHYLAENERVDRAFKAIQSGDMQAFLAAVNGSGVSSWTLNQNISTYHNPREQGLALALALADIALNGRGAARVHGGGFAGTIQCFVPNDMVDKFKAQIESVFKAGACHVLSLRKHGAFKFTL